MAVLSLFLLAVCVSDYSRKRIPNVWLLLLFAAGILYRWRNGGYAGVGGYFSHCLFLFLLLYPLFQLGTIGAGDVKLFAVTAGYLPGRAVLPFLFSSLLLAGIFSILKLRTIRNLRARFRYLGSYLAQTARTGKWTLYIPPTDEKGKTGVCLSGPVLISILLHISGILPDIGGVF
ncbi:MAG: A24 family peptidase [Clostridium sp.]|nr:A24 family peptidase [Clostridium sp.]